MRCVLCRVGFPCLILWLGSLFVPIPSLGQTYYDNQTQYSNQDPNTETRRSDHFRVCFGHYNRDSTPMTEGLAQGNLQMFEHLWDRWVTEMSMHDLNESATNPDGSKHKTNFNFLMTWNDGGGGGAYMSMDGNGFAYAMANPGYCRYDPPSGATPHEMGHVWEGTAAGFNGSDSSGAWWECTADWMQLQFLNTYPQAGAYIYNPMYYPAHGRNYYHSWPIWETARDDPRYGAAWVNRIWTDATPDQQQHEYIIDRMMRCDTSGSADKAGAAKDLWGDMAKKCVNWDFERKRWLAQANSTDDGSDWNFYQRCRTPLVKVPGMSGWYRPERSHIPQEFGFNIIPLAASPGATVSCNFQPLCDPVRQSDWRACLVAISNNDDARYSCLWSKGTNSITLSADESKFYLVVIAAPKAMKVSDPAWQMYLTDAGLQLPYAVSFTNATPKNVVYPVPNVTHTHHPNGGGLVQSGATVDSTAYVGPNAMVLDSAQVRGYARIEDYAVVKNSAQVRDNAVVSGHAVVQDTAQVYGNAKVRDWARVFGNAKVYENAKVIEHANFGDSGNVAYGSAIIKGTTYVYSPSTFSGCLIMEGDSANGGTGDHGVHLGWAWGQDTGRFGQLTDNGYIYCQLTFERDNAVFATDQDGINHGFLMNGCRVAKDTVAPTRGGRVLLLDGVSQYIELHNSVNDFKETAVCVWVKWTGSASDQRIWSMGDWAGKYMYLTPKDSTTGKLRFVISDGTTTQYLDGAAAMPANPWTHVAVVFSGSTSTLYVNGAAVASDPSTTIFPDQLNAALTENANYLGRGDAGNYFQGYLDDFRVYMKALTAAEVSAVYSTPPPGPITVTPDTTAPTPNPATWLVAPDAVSDNAITMSATPGTDASGWVEYYFTCTSGGGHDSGWVSFSKYTDVGLTPGTAYTYTVKMRDNNGDTTAQSTGASATTQSSTIGTASFAYGPVGISSSQITMTATKLSSPSGLVEYKFTSNDAITSGWQASPAWTNTGLTANATYTYTVQVRDGRGNIGAVSSAVSATAKDMAAPQLPMAVAHWNTQPYATIDNRISMTAMGASDPSGVQYYFECVSGGGPNSNWQDSATFTTGVVADGTYVYRYKVRDKSAQYNESPYSVTSSATVSPFRGYHSSTLAQLASLPDDYLASFSGTVMRVNPSNYVVKDLVSGAAITVRPSTYAEATDPANVLKNVSVKGHLYTFSDTRVVTYATVTVTGNPTTYTISGRVTNTSAVGISGATVYFSDAPNPSANPIVTATSDANGNYSKAATNGTWYVAAGAVNYYTSADQTVTVNGANVPNVNFTLTAMPRVSGKVTNTSGVGIAGATACFSTTANAVLHPTYTTTTDSQGNYSRGVNDGTWYVAAYAVGYNSSADRTVVVSGETVTGIDFTLKSFSTPPALVALSASSLVAGGLTMWNNSGTLGGSFGNDGTTPAVETVAAKKCVTFDGSDRMKASFTAPSGITSNGDWSVAAIAYNPDIGGEECMVSWAQRGSGSRDMQFNYGNAPGWGAATHYANDLGWANGIAPTAGTWHHLVLTYDGTTEKVYVDGILNNTSAKALNIFAGQPMYLGCAYEPGPSPNLYFSGSLASVRVVDKALTASQVFDLYLNNATQTSTVSGTVTDSGGTAVSGASVHFSKAPNAWLQPDAVATTDSSGYYAWDLPDGTWYAAAGKAGYNTTADKTAVISGANIPNVNFVLTSGVPPVDVYYRFDETTGTTAADSSGNAKNGTLTNGPTWVAGRVNNCISFDGVDDYVSVPNLGQYTAITIASWVNLDSLGSDAFGSSVISTDGWAAGDVQFSILKTTGKLRFGLNGDTPAEVDSNYAFGAADFGKWRHAALVYDLSSATVKFYVNGALDSTQTLTTAAAAMMSGGIRVGAWGGGRCLDGKLDELYIYKRALVESQILGLVSAGPSLSIGAAKKMSDGDLVTLSSKIVTYAPRDASSARTTNHFYVEESDRYAGIRVLDGDSGQDDLDVDLLVTLTGILQTDGVTQEKCLVLNSAPRMGIGDVLDPLGVNTRSVVSDANTVGLFVRVAGQVKSVAPDGLSFTMSDGYTISRAEKTVTVVTEMGQAITNLAAGNVVVVNGVVSKSDPTTRVILLRKLTRLVPPETQIPASAYYKFDETSGSTAVDSSGMGNDATLSTTGCTWVPGKINNAVDFNNGYVAAPNLGSGYGQVTIATWLNVRSLAQGSGWDGTSISSSDGWYPGCVHFLLLGANNSSDYHPRKIQLSVCGAPGNDLVWSDFTFTDDKLNTWVHVAAVYDAPGGSAEIYINGLLDGAATFATNQSADLTAVKIGSWETSRYFSGKTDDFRVYDRALTASEIQQIYNGELS